MLSFTVYIILITISCNVCAQNDLLLVHQNHVNNIKNSLANNETSTECLQQLNILYKSLLNEELWAWQMLDSHGRIPSGILVDNYYHLGNYDECLNVKNKNISGKYCLGTIPISVMSNTGSLQLTKGGQLRMLGNNPQFTGVHLAICLPDKCTADDASNIHPLSEFSEKYCYTEDTLPELTLGAVATISILSFFLLLVILSTSYEVYLYYKNYKPGRNITVAFSYFLNGRKLLQSSKSPDQLLCLNGIKAISMMWIVMAHEYVNGCSGAVANYSKITEFPNQVANMYVIGATVAVDTFFVIGGLVTVYTFLKSVEKKVKFNFFFYYIHRYIRLTPALGIIVLIHATLLKYFGNGPLWNAFDDHLVEPCRKHYWAALLYIQNYINDGQQVCVPQSWYLSIDMQLFILSPIILIPMKIKPKLTLIGLFILTLSGIIVPFCIAYFDELYAFMGTDLETTHKYMFSYYEQTYGRFGAYVIGMILGYFIYKIKQEKVKVNLKPIMVLFLWTTCLTGGLACVYAGHDTMLSEYNKWSHSLYIAFNRPAWSLAISGIIFLCVSGFGGPVNVFLSAPIFQFLSKISYSIYLVHYELILLRTYSYKTEIMIEDFYMFFNFWGDFIFSVVLALVLCLTFESPMITIEKILLHKESIQTKTQSNLTA